MEEEVISGGTGGDLMGGIASLGSSVLSGAGKIWTAVKSYKRPNASDYSAVDDSPMHTGTEYNTAGIAAALIIILITIIIIMK